MDSNMDVGDDLILCWDWISGHDLRHLYVDGRVSLQSGPAILLLALLPADVRPAARTLSVIGHGEFRRLLRQIERVPSRALRVNRARPSADPLRTAAAAAAAAAPPLAWVVTTCPRRPRGAGGPRGGTEPRDRGGLHSQTGEQMTRTAAAVGPAMRSSGPGP